MKLKSLALRGRAGRGGLRAAAPAAFAQAKEQFIPGAVLPHRRLRAQRRAVRQRLCRLPEARQRQGRHQRREDHLRGMRDRLRHRQGRRVLRAPEGQARRRVAGPAAVHRHHLRADREGAGRQDPAHHRRLRPQRQRRRQRLQVELPAARHLLGGRRHAGAAHRQEGRRPGQAQGQEDRPRLPRQPVRQGADPAAAGAPARCTASSCSCCR